VAERWRNPSSGLGEVDTALAFLAELRESVIAKLDGLDARSAAAMPLASKTSLTGLVRHLTDAEQYWTRFVFAAEPDIDFYGFEESWDVDPPPDPDEAVARYRRVGHRTEHIVRAATSPEQVAARDHGDGAPTLRWILAHLIEETARHAGHADVLRELHDGAIGR
jgi:uncharacterized damage-inducible protein DinB